MKKYLHLLIIVFLFCLPAVAEAATNRCMKYPTGTPVNCVDSASGGSGDFLADGTVPMTGDIDMATSGITADGDLKLVADSTGNLTLFEDTDVGDTTDGNSLYIYRKAVEGDLNLTLYVDADMNAHIDSDLDLEFNAPNNIYFSRNPTASSLVQYFHQAGSGDQSVIRQHGYITADADDDYVQWEVNDTTDNFELTKSGANLGSFDIQMPVIISDQSITLGDGSTGDITLTLDGDAGTDGTLVWDVSEDALVLDSVLQLFDDATPSVDTAADVAFDTNIWAASRGGVLVYDGTAVTVLAGVLASDPPNNGETLKWNTGGTITWETDNDSSAITGADTLVVFMDGANTPSVDAGLSYNKTTNTLTADAFIATPSATPSSDFTDSDATDGDLSATFAVNCTDCGSGTEDVDVTLSQQVAGAMTAFLTADADGDVVIARFQDASLTVEGDVELATTAEIDTGTDSTRAIPVDQFVASKRNIRWLVFNLVEAGTDVATATNIAGDFVSPIAGTILQNDSTPFYLYATNSTAGTTGTMVVDISIGGTSIMTTNKLDFDTTEKTTTTAATPPDLTTTALAVGDIITIDIDAIHTTAAKGLTVYMAVRE